MSDPTPFDPQQPPPYEPVQTTQPFSGQPPYGQQPYGQPPYGQPPYGQPPVAAGLADNVAGAIAYVTFIPAIVFLVLEPYRSRPFVRFHALQSIGLTLVSVVLQLFHFIPVVGTIIAVVGGLAVFVLWLIAIVQAAMGKMWQMPFIGPIAAQQAGI